MRPEDVGGVHIRYLHHCHRQLWLYLRGIRPEHLSATVARGAVLHYPKTPTHQEDRVRGRGGRAGRGRHQRHPRGWQHHHVATAVGADGVPGMQLL
jgi:hypothetical protein